MTTRSISKKQSEIKKIFEILKTTAISSNDYVSSQEPFFNNDSASQPFQQFNMLFTNAQIPEGLNRNIKVIYELLGHQKKKFIMAHGPL